MDLKRLYIMCIGGAIVITVVFSILYGSLRDKTGPVITVGSTAIVYHEGDDRAILLEGVTAYDKKDGDVTDSLIVDSIVPLETEGKMRVIYAAKDTKNNVSKSSKVITYIPLPEEEKSDDEQK